VFAHVAKLLHALLEDVKCWLCFGLNSEVHFVLRWVWDAVCAKVHIGAVGVRVRKRDYKCEIEYRM